MADPGLPIDTAATRVFERFEAAYFWLRATVSGATVDASKINDQIWCGGGIETKKDVAWLKKQGVTADIDLREEYNEQSLTAGQLLYLYDPTADDGLRKPPEWFTAAWTFAEPILKDGGVVYCHCAAGINRGPSMAYFLLRATTQLPGQAARALILAKRPVAKIGYWKDADAALKALGLVTDPLPKAKGK